MADPSTLEQVADELYAGPPEDFVTVRTERAKQARSAGDRPLATAITALRRPTRSAWMVNLLARGEADQLTALLDLGDALRRAQEELSGPDLRRLSTQRHRAVEALTKRAAALAAEHDVPATEAVRREISQSLQAALADPATADLVRAGQLSQAADYSGFGPFVPGGAAEPAGDSAPSSGDAPEQTPAGRTPAAREVQEQEAARRREEQAAREAEIAAREAEIAAAEARSEEATRTAEQAHAVHDDLTDQVNEALAGLAALRAQLQRAEQALTAADQERAEAASAVDALKNGTS